MTLLLPFDNNHLSTYLSFIILLLLPSLFGTQTTQSSTQELPRRRLVSAIPAMPPPHLHLTAYTKRRMEIYELFSKTTLALSTKYQNRNSWVVLPIKLQVLGDRSTRAPKPNMAQGWGGRKGQKEGVLPSVVAALWYSQHKHKCR